VLVSTVLLPYRHEQCRRDVGRMANGEAAIMAWYVGWR